MKYVYPRAGKWETITSQELERARKAGMENEVEAILEEYRAYEKNPLAHFLPHGVAWHKHEKAYAEGRIILPPSKYPREYKNDGVAFQNDWEHDYIMLKASRKTGKTYAGAVKMGLWMLKLDPDWPCFSGRGGWLLNWREWRGPQQVIVSSFGTQNLAEVWNTYLKVWPREELGAWAPGYPRTDLGEPAGGRPRHIAFGDGRPKSFTPQKSGGRIIFLLYTQMQHVWMNFRASGWHADEQPQMDRLDAFESGASNVDYSPIFFTWSGFKLKDRPDTGMAGGMYQIWTGKDLHGKTEEQIGRYNLDVESTPDEIFPARKKKQMYDKFANPEIERSRRTERLGLAVYYPGDEPGAGLCFGPDVWDRRIHIIDPLWADDQAPRGWTKWRIIDYADTKTTCVLWGAVGPKFAVIYRVLYEQGMTVYQTARKIIEMSHNQMIEIGLEENEETGAIYRTYEEIQSGEEYYCDIIDRRMGSNKKQGIRIIELFRAYGLDGLEGASSLPNEDQIGNLKDMLEIDWQADHPYARDAEGRPIKGASKLYFFDGICRPVIDEIESMPADEDGNHVIDLRYPHDAIDCLKYWASERPAYMGDSENENSQNQNAEYEETRTPFTAY